MTLGQLEQALKEFQKEMKDEEIAEVLVAMYIDNRIDKKCLDAGLGILGLSITDANLNRMKKRQHFNSRNKSFNDIKEKIIEFKEKEIYDKKLIITICSKMYLYNFLLYSEFCEICEAMNFKLSKDFVNSTYEEKKKIITGQDISKEKQQLQIDVLYEIFGEVLNNLKYDSDPNFNYKSINKCFGKDENSKKTSGRKYATPALSFHESYNNGKKSIDVSLFGLDKKTSSCILEMLIDTYPKLHLCDELSAILYEGVQEVSDELEECLQKEKQAILEYAEFITFID